MATCPFCGTSVEVVDDEEIGDVYGDHAQDPKHPTGPYCDGSGVSIDFNALPEAP